MKRLIDKLEEVRDSLYDTMYDVENEKDVNEGEEKYYWIRLNSDQLNTVYHLLGDEIRNLQ